MLSEIEKNKDKFDSIKEINNIPYIQNPDIEYIKAFNSFKINCLKWKKNDIERNTVLVKILNRLSHYEFAYLLKKIEDVSPFVTLNLCLSSYKDINEMDFFLERLSIIDKNKMLYWIVENPIRVNIIKSVAASNFNDKVDRILEKYTSNEDNLSKKLTYREIENMKEVVKKNRSSIIITKLKTISREDFISLLLFFENNAPIEE